MTSSATPQILTIDGHKVAVLPITPDAEGTPVFFIHGVTQSVYFWIPAFIEPFQKLGPCYALSLPGHYPGGLPRDFASASLTPDLIARLLAEAIRQTVGDRPVMLVGHSMGGLSSLAIAALYPDRVTRVVSLVGYAQGEWIGTIGMFQRWSRGGPLSRMLFSLSGFVGLGVMFTLAERSRVRGSAGKSLAFYNSPHNKTLSEANRPAATHLDWPAMQKIFSAMHDADIRDLLPQIRVPTLVMGGHVDPVVPPQQAHLLAECISGATLAMMPGVGHYPMLENFDEYNRILADWLIQPN